jgi:hypothetical protein
LGKPFALFVPLVLDPPVMWPIAKPIPLEAISTPIASSAVVELDRRAGLRALLGRSNGTLSISTGTAISSGRHSMGASSLTSLSTVSAGLVIEILLVESAESFVRWPQNAPARLSNWLRGHRWARVAGAR